MAFCDAKNKANGAKLEGARERNFLVIGKSGICMKSAQNAILRVGKGYIKPYLKERTKFSFVDLKWQ